MKDKNDINIGDRVTFFDETSTHKKGLVVDITNKFGGDLPFGKYSFNMQDYHILGDDGEEYELDMKRDYLKRDYITERDIKIENILKDGEGDNEGE